MDRAGYIITILTVVFIAAVKTQPTLQFPIVANVYEEERSKIVLTDLECTTGSAPVAVSMTPLAANIPCHLCFAVYQESSPHFQLFYLPSQGNLSYSLKRDYNIDITCTDAASQTGTTVVNVRVKTNEPPKFGSFSDTVTNIDATNAGTNTLVYTVADATDPDSDPIFYSMTVIPQSSAYKYTIGITNGKITTLTNLYGECFPSVTFFIYIEDKRNLVVGPKVVTIQFSNHYRSPTIPGLNRRLSLSEDLPVTSIIGTDVQATPSSPTVTYTHDTAPQFARHLFEVYDSPPQPPRLRLKNKLDFESGLTFINVTVIPSNDFCSANHFYLELDIFDANDPPVISPRDVVVLVYEGQVTYDGEFSTTDQDPGDSATFSIIGGNFNNLFYIDALTGVITSPGYDYDNGTYPNQIVLTIQATDVLVGIPALVEKKFFDASMGRGRSLSKDKVGHLRGGVDNTTVTLNFLDSNDNPPVIPAPATVPDAHAEECAITGAVIGAVAPVDAVDSTYNNNNQVSCVPSSNGYLQVLSTCSIILTGTLQANNITTLYIRATDHGTVPGPLLSAPVPFTVLFTPCTTTSTVGPTTVITTMPPTTVTTTPAPTVPGLDAVISPTEVNGDNGTGNMPWIVTASILGCVLVACGAFAVSRYILPRIKGSKKFKPGASNRKLSPQNNPDTSKSNGKNNAKPVTPREVQPYEPKRGPDDYRQGGPNLQQKNVWRGNNQPHAAFDL